METASVWPENKEENYKNKKKIGVEEIKRKIKEKTIRIGKKI